MRTQLIYKLHPKLSSEPQKNAKSSSSDNTVRTMFLKQGDMDGACGIYSIWTALIIFGVVSYREIHSGRAFKNPALKPAWLKSRDLFFDGSDEDEMGELLSSLRQFIRYRDVSCSMRAVIEFTIERLNKSELVVLSFKQNVANSGHWILAVGVEEFRTGNERTVTAILCVDAEEPEPTVAPFNVRIKLPASLRGAKHVHYVSASGERQNVELVSAFALTAQNK